MDCRFQDYRRPVDPGTLVFAGTGKRSWDSIYAKWRNDDLKYYWKRLPLHFKPTRSELAVLAETAPTPELCSRYANILRLIQAQYS